jgi:predicted TIM-barrel fold metal-dependent hydrolase
MQPITGRIDIHHHALPLPYLTALNRSGKPQLAGVDPIAWSVESDLDVMDRNGIQVAILSVTAPGATIVDGADAGRLCRETNEAFARLISDNKARYGALAIVPLPDVAAAIREIDFALDVLGLDGVGLLTNFSGVYLGDPRLEPVFRHLADRDAVAFVHPNIPASNDQRTFDLPPSLYEFTFDTTRAVANLLFSGTLDRYPNLRLVLSHAGGTVPYLAKRLTYASTIASRLRSTEPKDIIGSLRRLYYDTAMSANPYTLSGLTALVNADQILFGSDYPYMPESTTRETVEGVVSFFSPDAREKVERTNYVRLFPRLSDRVCQP